jgi:hypothetical protein
MVVEKASGRDSPLRQGAGKSSWILPISLQRRWRLIVCFEEKRSVPRFFPSRDFIGEGAVSEVGPGGLTIGGRGQGLGRAPWW